MNLVFISGLVYPFEGAAANRIIAYAKGLSELGHKVTFILILNQPEISGKFSIEDIDFFCGYPDSPDYERTNKFKRLLLYIKSVRNSLRIIKTIHRGQKIDAMILLPVFLRDLIPYIFLAKTINVKLLHERTEYPFMVAGGNEVSDWLRLKIYLSIILKQFDGIYVISNALKKYFTSIVKSDVHVEIINMIVDSGRFKNVNLNPDFDYKYIVYCGTLNSEKDGVDILVEAYCSSIEAGRIPQDVKLMLIGDFVDDKFRTSIESIIKKNNCRGNIVFTGKLERDKIPPILNNASALALARPFNKQSEGGFPTKLGEYLATGKPVIITAIGEIEKFLKDGYNSFIAKSDDIDSFSQKIEEVFSDYSRALVIGRNGRLLTENEFNYLKQARKLASFIESL